MVNPLGLGFSKSAKCREQKRRSKKSKNEIYSYHSYVGFGWIYFYCQLAIGRNSKASGHSKRPSGGCS